MGLGFWVDRDDLIRVNDRNRTPSLFPRYPTSPAPWTSSNVFLHARSRRVEAGGSDEGETLRHSSSLPDRAEGPTRKAHTYGRCTSVVDPSREGVKTRSGRSRDSSTLKAPSLPTGDSPPGCVGRTRGGDDQTQGE